MMMMMRITVINARFGHKQKKLQRWVSQSAAAAIDRALITNKDKVG